MWYNYELYEHFIHEVTTIKIQSLCICFRFHFTGNYPGIPGYTLKPGRVLLYSVHQFKYEYVSHGQTPRSFFTLCSPLALLALHRQPKWERQATFFTTRCVREEDPRTWTCRRRRRRRRRRMRSPFKYKYKYKYKYKQGAWSSIYAPWVQVLCELRPLFQGTIKYINININIQCTAVQKTGGVHTLPDAPWYLIQVQDRSTRLKNSKKSGGGAAWCEIS